MAGKARDWVKQFRQQTPYWLNYPPSQPMRLGDIVVKESGVWRIIGNTEDRGVGLDAVTDDSEAGVPWVRVSESGVKMETTLEADPGVFRYVQPGHAGVKVSLDAGSKWLLSLKGARFHRIRNMDAYWAAVRAEYSSWTWPLGRKIVTDVCEAESATFLGSGTSATAYELQAEAGVSVNGVNFGDLSAGFTLISNATTAESFAGMTKITPVFRLHRVTALGNLDPADLAATDVDGEPLVDYTQTIEDDSGPEDED